MGAPTKETSKAVFPKTLEDNGGALGNGALLGFLEWTEKRYWKFHSELLNDGKIIRGRGQGGSVLLNKLSQQSAVVGKYPAADKVEDQKKLESSLYEPASKVISERWVQERGFDDHVVAVTATKGFAGSGIWTRPDIAAVATKSYPFCLIAHSKL